MSKLPIQLTLLVVLFGTLPSLAKVDIYPSAKLLNPADGLAAVESSDRYQVTVTQSDGSHIPFTHISRARTEGPGSQFIQGRTIAWTDFSLSGTATITVSQPDDRPLPQGAVTVYPLRHEIIPQRIDGAVRFQIPGPGQYLVTLEESGFEHALAIFANPLVSTRPSTTDPGVATIDPGYVNALEHLMPGKHTLNFPPGVYKLPGEVVLPENIKRVYIAGGAVVYGSFQINHDDVTVDGRGILSGLYMAHKEAHMVESSGEVKGTVVEGITVAHFPYFAVRLLGTDSVIRWVKTIGAWIYNCDGFVAWERSTMRNSFIMANDDAIKLYDSNVSVKDVITWNLTNGAALQMGWSSLEAHNVHVDGLDVINAEWRTEGNSENNGVINLRLGRGGGKTQSGWIFENINVDTPVLRIFDLRMRGTKNPTGADHDLRDVLIRNVDAKMLRLKDNPVNYNFITSYDETYRIRNLVFENLVINGKTITDENARTYGQFQIDDLSRPEVRFINTRAETP